MCKYINTQADEDNIAYLFEGFEANQYLNIMLTWPTPL